MSIKVLSGSQVSAPTRHSVVVTHACPTQPKHHARRVLLVVWALFVAAPWTLQLRSFSQLVVRHKITQNLLPPKDATVVKTASDVVTHCPLSGMHLAGVWYTMYASHYYESQRIAKDSALCHYVFPQYNAHGMYNVQKHKVKPVHSAPRNCWNDSYAINYYMYHGSIGYFALYTEGSGSYCSLDGTAYMVSNAIGSNDINFNSLAKFEGVSGYYSSYFFGCVGTGWLAYRALVLARSFLSCSRYGRRLDALHEPIAATNAIVYIQQAARLAPHEATNWHRLGLVYLLIEGLMTDLFLVVAFDGFGAKVQYISLGYNISGLLSMLFEMLENSKLMKPATQLLVKRVLFNTELTLWGEFLFSIAMSYYITALARSPLGRTPQVAEAASYYLWSLFNHGIVVLGQTLFILTVRVLGTLAFVQWRFGSVSILTVPCCVDTVMGYRCKLVKISGYELRDNRLWYSKETLKAHGLFKIVDEKRNEYLVYHKIHWLPSNREDLAIIGKLTGEHVDVWPETLYDGPVAVCDRVLGGDSTGDWPFCSECDEHDLETARLVPTSA